MPDEPLTRAPLSEPQKEELDNWYKRGLLSPEQRLQELRSYGTELLKRSMWEKLGVDYTKDQFGRYDDTPTMKEMQRRNAFGRPSIGDLQGHEIQMEQQLKRPLTPDQIFPPPRETPINLVPVEHDPYNPFVNLVPTDEDPFAAKGAQSSSPPPIDYDYAGAAAAGLKPDERGHMPDTYKLPNHITFSNESVYHGKNGTAGGQWDKLPDDKWMFTPGRTNLENYSPIQLQQYFQQYEPDSLLNIPAYPKE